MPGYYAINTNPEYMYGENRLGKILMTIRAEIRQELQRSQTPPPVQNLESTLVELTNTTSKVPKSAPPDTATDISDPPVLPGASATPHIVPDPTNPVSAPTGSAPAVPPTELPEQVDCSIPASVCTDTISQADATVSSATTPAGDIASVSTEANASKVIHNHENPSTAKTSHHVDSNPASASSSDVRLSIADEIAKVENVATTKKPTRSAVRRKIQPSQGPMDNFLSKLKRKLSPEKESDTRSGDVNQYRSDEPIAYQSFLLCLSAEHTMTSRIGYETIRVSIMIMLLIIIYCKPRTGTCIKVSNNTNKLFPYYDRCLVANYKVCYSQSRNNKQDISAWLTVCSHLYNNEYILYLRLLRNIYCNHINLFPTIINIVLKHLHTCIWDLSYGLYYDDIYYFILLYM